VKCHACGTPIAGTFVRMNRSPRTQEKCDILCLACWLAAIKSRELPVREEEYAGIVEEGA